MPDPAHPTAGRGTDASARQLLDLIAGLVREAGSGSPGAQPPLSLDSNLERDLGLDSLAKTELMVRIERGFQLGLPEQALNAETPRDLLRLLLAAERGSQAAALARDVRYEVPTAGDAAPAHAETLVQVLDWYVQRDPERTCLYVYEDTDRASEFSYRALYQGACSVAVGLRDRGLQPGETAAIMLPTGVGYFLSFFGILLAGGVPVPIYPPVRPSQIEEHLRRHGRILASARASTLITVTQAKAVARLLQAQVPALRHVVTVADLEGSAEGWTSPRLRGEDTAFLQYTSGSTGDPKGVILSHANLLANLRCIGSRIEASSRDVFVSWLPLYHDMGLIGACLGSLYYGFPLAVMSPLAFLAKPSRWLWAIHRHRGTLGAAPNFAYELCLRHVTDGEIQGLDLSSWRIAFNGAEPVSVDTVERFCRRFAPYGFRAGAMAPVYGLAECSLGLTIQPPDRGAVIDRIQRDAFMGTGKALPAGEGEPNPLAFAACGPPIPSHQVRIVDDRGRELPERQEGRLEFKGPSATSGYLGNPEATRKLFHGDWLDSGDRAYIAEGDVYLTGRVKDVIIRGGRNIYPYELEDAVGEVEGVRKGCVAVFASTEPGTGTERLVVVAETREKDPQALAALSQKIRGISVDLLAVPPDDIVLARPHTVLKTSSGKIRRAAVGALYERNALGRGGGALWWQLLRVAVASIGPQVRRLIQRLAQSVYAAYAWAVFLCLAPPVWVALVVLPKRAWRWRFARGALGLLRRATATPLQVQGIENLPKQGAFVVVANHSSYLDSFVLTVAVPRNLSYVAKQELQAYKPVGLPLAGLGTLFVERFDAQRSTRDAGRLTQALQAGAALAFFPEGTFDRMPGILPFRIGAFLAAAQARVPVVPVTLRGTRSVLRSGSWFPRHGHLRVVVGKPIPPQGEDWQAAIALRDAARAVILRHCGEPDLAGEQAAVFRDTRQ